MTYQIKHTTAYTGTPDGRTVPIGKAAPRAGGDRGIVTDYWPKPIPDRRYDWSAVFDNYEPNDPIGYGSTEVAAIADLWDKLED